MLRTRFVADRSFCLIDTFLGFALMMLRSFQMI
jgi:hypothetical protein